MEELEEQVNRTYEFYESCQTYSPESECQRTWLNSNYNSRVERLESLWELRKSYSGGVKKPPIKIIRWRGIAKSVGSERQKIEAKLLCFDPGLTPEARALWEKASGAKQPEPDPKDNDDLQSRMELDLCQRFANF
jgi:hypothetical protein